MFKVQEFACSLGYGVNKTCKSQQPPALPLHGKNRTPRTLWYGPNLTSDPKTGNPPPLTRQKTHAHGNEPQGGGRKENPEQRKTSAGKHKENPSAGTQVTLGKESRKRIDKPLKSQVPNRNNTFLISGRASRGRKPPGRQRVGVKRETKEAVQYHDDPNLSEVATVE